MRGKYGMFELETRDYSTSAVLQTLIKYFMLNRTLDEVELGQSKGLFGTRENSAECILQREIYS